MSRYEEKCKKDDKKFAGSEKSPYLCTAFERKCNFGVTPKG